MNRDCVRCGGSFRPLRVNNVKCPECKGKPWKNKVCADCPTLIWQANKRCSACDDAGRVGEGNINFKGRSITTQGYVTLTGKAYRNHPNAQATGKILEHVYVMSEYLGRPLKKGEEVHHKYGIRSDNRIENLELWTRSHPTGVRVEDMYLWCQNYIEQYQSEIDKLI